MADRQRKGIPTVIFRGGVLCYEDLCSALGKMVTEAYTSPRDRIRLAEFGYGRFPLGLANTARGDRVGDDTSVGAGAAHGCGAELRIAPGLGSNVGSG